MSDRYTSGNHGQLYNSCLFRRPTQLLHMQLKCTRHTPPPDSLQQLCCMLEKKKKKKIYIACHWREQEISAKVLCKIKGFIKNTSHMMLSSTGDDLLQGKSTNSHYCFDQKASFPPALQYGPVCWTPGNRPHQGYLKHCCTLPLFSGWLPSAYQRSTEHKKQKPHLRG